MRRGVLVYLSGPITAREGRSIEANLVPAVRTYIDLLNLGIPAFCPHLSAAFPSCHTDVPYVQWLAYDFAIIERCTHLLMLPHWASSSGAVKERAYAESRRLPVYDTIDELRDALYASDRR